MNDKRKTAKLAEIEREPHTGIKLPCCPELVEDKCQEKMRFHYKLPFRPNVNNRDISVEVALIFEYSRCTEGLTKGDLQHTISLLPQEQVRLFTSDKSSRWSYDKETSLSYRHERTSSESHLSFGFAKAVTDIDISDSTSVDSSYDESWSEGGGGASINILGISIGGGGGGGSYSSKATYDFARNISQHAESASSYVAASVRASRSVSMGEVETRTHAEGESEQHFEASTRKISNNNHCHAVNYFVWQLMKKQKISWRLVAVQITSKAPSSPTDITNRPRIETKLSVVPQSILATDQLKMATYQPAQLTSHLTATQLNANTLNLAARAVPNRIGSEAIDDDLLVAAESSVKADLEKAGIIDDNGAPTKKIIAQLEWERTELIPTGGLVIKGCLDTCSVCEPSREHEIELKLAEQKLKNELLAKQIELLEKHKDYRCCDTEQPEPAEA